MSTTRRERRQRQQPIKTHKRKLDWTKFGQQYRSKLIVFLIVIPIITLTFFCSAWSNNVDRRNITVAPSSTKGVIISIQKRYKSGNNADYRFNVPGAYYTGRTLRSYNGSIGDKVSVTYNRTEPILNLLTEEMPEQTLLSVFNEVFFFGIIMLIFIIALPLILFVSILTGNRKAWLDISSEVR